VDEDGYMWIGDALGGVCLFDPVETKCIQVFDPPTNDFSLDRLCNTSQGHLAGGSNLKGLYVLADGEWLTLQTDDPLQFNEVKAIAQTPDGQIWVANGSVLQHFPANQSSAAWEVETLPQNAIAHSLFVANDGLWIGHTRGARFLPYLEGFEIVDIPLLDLPMEYDHTVTAISKDANGLVYLGLSTGLYIWDGSELVFDDLLSEAQRKNKVLPPEVNRIYADGDEVWVGTSLGLYKFVEGSRRLSWADALQNVSSFYAQSVGVLAHNPRGAGLLVGIGRELFTFDGRQFTLVLRLPTEIRSIYCGPYQIWLATANSGLYTIPMDDTNTIYWGLSEKNNALPGSYGYEALLMSDTHTLWVASSKNGLIRLTGTYGQ
jgi:ligand-binding sensor domain-containing protein